MGRFHAFDHTADVGMRVEADSLADLFETAARAVFGYMIANHPEIRESHTDHFELQADSLESLFLLWLNELIFRGEVQHHVYAAFEVHIDEPACRLRASIRGEPIDFDRHVADHEVKAATHHGIGLRKEHTGWIAEFILDI